MKFLGIVIVLLTLFALIDGLPHRDVGYPGRQPAVVIVKQPIISQPRPQSIVVNQRPQVGPQYGQYHHHH